MPAMFNWVCAIADNNHITRTFLDMSALSSGSRVSSSINLRRCKRNNCTEPISHHQLHCGLCLRYLITFQPSQSRIKLVYASSCNDSKSMSLGHSDLFASLALEFPLWWPEKLFLMSAAAIVVFYQHQHKLSVVITCKDDTKENLEPLALIMKIR